MAKTCNKSGYEVKHSKYMKSSMYEAINQISQPIDTKEEVTKADWQQEIKHLKTLLGTMAEDMDHKYVHTTSGSNKLLLKEQQCRIL